MPRRSASSLPPETKQSPLKRRRSRKPATRSIPTPKPLPKSFLRLVLDNFSPNHIIHDKSSFWAYTAGARDVRLLDGSILKVLGSGEVRIKMIVESKPLVIRLLDCWHTPSSPINRISISKFISGNFQVICANKSSRILLPHSLCQADRLLPKYVPINREKGSFYLNVTFVPPPQTKSSSLPTVPPALGPTVAPQPHPAPPLRSTTHPITESGSSSKSPPQVPSIPPIVNPYHLSLHAPTPRRPPTPTWPGYPPLPDIKIDPHAFIAALNHRLLFATPSPPPIAVPPSSFHIYQHPIVPGVPYHYFASTTFTQSPFSGRPPDSGGEFYDPYFSS
ncbi:hypothetical protein FPV67DRAFT_1681690 [Lyophyllum atratum]|nr:hypothetical protein FPV67DRAFT_1681690 [Lyophyllum atratum]